MPCPTKSSALASHYHGRGERTGGLCGHHHGIHYNHCNRYGRIKVDCRTKARERQRQPQVIVVAQPMIIKGITIPVVDYNDLLQFKVAHQPSSFVVVAQSNNPVIFVSTSSLGH